MTSDTRVAIMSKLLANIFKFIKSQVAKNVTGDETRMGSLFLTSKKIETQYC